MKYNELFRLLNENVWYEIRQKGSHVTMRHDLISGTITVPYHSGKEVKKGLLKAILKQTNINTQKR